MIKKGDKIVGTIDSIQEDAAGNMLYGLIVVPKDPDSAVGGFHVVLNEREIMLCERVGAEYDDFLEWRSMVNGGKSKTPKWVKIGLSTGILELYDVKKVIISYEGSYNESKLLRYRVITEDGKTDIEAKNVDYIQYSSDVELEYDDFLGGEWE